MNQSIHNIRQVLLFRGLAFALVGLGCWPFFADVEQVISIPIFIASLVVVAGLWIMMDPGYLAVEVSRGQLLISTDKEDKNAFFLALPVNEVAGYEIEKKYGGLNRQLYLYRKTPKGFLKSKAVPMSLYTPGQTKALRAKLDALIKTNGFEHLMR